VATAIRVTGRVSVNGELGAEALKSRLRHIRDALSEGLVERDIPIRLALLAALAGEHLLLIGPPGTAKSELARRLRLAFTGQTYFERLLTRFSVPEELFGPLSIKALENDQYERQITGYLPTAAVAFLDEIFKANSAILNALLTLLNEREFDNGTQRIKTPLVSVIGASNELPQQEELLALYDRFLVRLHVGPVSDDGFSKLLDLRGHAKPTIEAALMLTPADLEQIHARTLEVAVPAEVASLIKALRKFCQDQQIPVSDRRWRKALFLLQVAAHTDGRTAVSVWDCWLLQHCLWHKPDQLAELFEWYTARIGEATVHDPGQLGRHVAAWEAKLESDRNQGPQKRNERGKLLYVAADGTETTESYRYDEGQRVENAPVIETRYYPIRYIEERTSGVAWVREQIATGMASLDADAADVEDAVKSHLWLDPAFAAPAQRRIAQQREILNALDERAKRAFSGFEALQKTGTLPDELAAIPPSMLQAFKTIAVFCVNEQRRKGRALDDPLELDEDAVPQAVRAALLVLQFSLDGPRSDKVNEALDTRMRLTRYFTFLREYLVIDKAPKTVFEQIDSIQALVSTLGDTDDISEGSRHILGMVETIRYGSNPRHYSSLRQSFDKFWNDSLSLCTSRYHDWILLGLLTDEE
jgi:MoxR-like ATPase